MLKGADGQDQGKSQDLLTGIEPGMVEVVDGDRLAADRRRCRRSEKRETKGGGGEWVRTMKVSIIWGAFEFGGRGGVWVPGWVGRRVSVSV